jgi:FtsZ-binding cell division protein ZapB
VEFTEKAVKEIKKLQEELEGLEREEKTLSSRLMTDPYDRILFDALRRERNRLYTKTENKQNRIDSITRRGMSTSETTALCKFAKNNGHTVETDRSLGCNGATKVLYYPKNGNFYSVSYTRYNGFMRNVKGCSGLADTTSWGDPVHITEAEAREKMSVKNHHGFSENKVTVVSPEEVETIMARMKGVAA